MADRKAPSLRVQQPFAAPLPSFSSTPKGEGRKRPRSVVGVCLGTRRSKWNPRDWIDFFLFSSQKGLSSPLHLRPCGRREPTPPPMVCRWQGAFFFFFFAKTSRLTIFLIVAMLGVSRSCVCFFVPRLLFLFCCKCPKDLHDWGSDLVTETITELRGYYVKTGQVRRYNLSWFQSSKPHASVRIETQRYSVRRKCQQ